MANIMLVPTLMILLMETIFCYSYINKELELRTLLFNASRYSPLVTPRINTTDSVYIVIQWSFITLKALSEKESRLSLSVTAHLTWTDDYLTWDPANYGGLRSIGTTGKEIWTPDFEIYNKLNSDFFQDGFDALKLTVSFDGTVHVLVYGDLDTICTVDPEKFPVDCHNCQIIFGVLQTNTQQTIIWDTVQPFIFYDSFKNGHGLWQIEKVEKVPLQPPSLMMSLVLKRLPAHYLYNIVFPAAGLAFLSILTFFIPIAEGERLSFGMTIFLSFMVIMLQASSLLPENSKKISAVGKYFLQLLCSSLVAIFNSVIMSYFQDKQGTPEKKLSSIHPDDFDHNKKIEACNEQLGIVVNDKKTCNEMLKLDLEQDKTTSSRKTAFGLWQINKIYMSWLRPVFTPLRIFDWITTLACVVTCLYAHIALYAITQEDTCANAL